MGNGNCSQLCNHTNNKTQLNTLFISNELFKSTIFYHNDNKYVKLSNVYAITFEIWNFELYFDVKNQIVVENVIMVKNLVQEQKLLQGKNNVSMMSDLQKIVQHITKERMNNNDFTDHVYALLMKCIEFIMKEIVGSSLETVYV